jgi:hypothetical protein
VIGRSDEAVMLPVLQRKEIAVCAKYNFLRLAPGIYLAVWVEGPEGAQDIYYRFFAR